MPEGFEPDEDTIDRILEEVEILTAEFAPVIVARINITQDRALVSSALLTMYHNAIEQVMGETH